MLKDECGVGPESLLGRRGSQGRGRGAVRSRWGVGGLLWPLESCVVLGKSPPGAPAALCMALGLKCISGVPQNAQSHINDPLSLPESPGHRVCAVVELWALFWKGPGEVGVCAGAVPPLPRPVRLAFSGAAPQHGRPCTVISLNPGPARGRCAWKPEQSGYPSGQASGGLQALTDSGVCPESLPPLC